MAYHAEQKFDQAMADMNQAIKLNPNYGKAFYERGMTNYDKQAFDRTVIAAKGADKPAYIVNFGDRGVSYGNRREGDRIVQDPHRVIKNNQYNAFAYSPSPDAPMMPLIVTNHPQMLVAPDPAAAAERKEQAKKAVDERPAMKAHIGKTVSASVMPVARPEQTAAAIPTETVPLPLARPRALPPHRGRRTN
jgi:hypothetical protein